MSDKHSQMWYSKIVVAAVDSLDINCPRCNKPFPIDPLFEKELRTCQKCDARLAEWNMLRVIYLIDVDRAPDIIQHVVSFVIAQKSHAEADKQLSILLDFFDS